MISTVIIKTIVTAEECCEIVLSIDKEILTCIIADDGIGRSKAEMLKSKSAENKKSFGQQITKERLALLNSNTNNNDFLKIEDIKDDRGNEAGTRVILKLNYKTLVNINTEINT